MLKECEIMYKDEIDKDKYQKYEKIMKASCIELYEMALMLTGHDFLSTMDVPQKYQDILYRDKIYTFAKVDNIGKNKIINFFKVLEFLKNYAEKDNKTIHIYYQNDFDNEDYISSEEIFFVESSKNDLYDFSKQSSFIFLKSPLSIIKTLYFQGFVLPIELQEIIGLRQYERDKKVSMIIEERHLRLQATALALFITSENNIGVDDICDDPIMKKMNSDFYYREKTKNNKDFIARDFTKVRELVSKAIETKKGRKNQSYKEFRIEWKNNYKSKKLFPLKKYDINFRCKIKNYFKYSKKLQNVYEIKENHLYIDFVRVRIVLDTWKKLVSLGFLSDHFISDFISMFFAEVNYNFGFFFPDTIFGHFYYKRLEDPMY